MVGSILLQKCKICGRIKRLGVWTFFGNLEQLERENLTVIMLDGRVAWQITFCPDCRARQSQKDEA